jgi:alkylation response protein AidB-like acyl-CoA dehydrogenase
MLEEQLSQEYRTIVEQVTKVAREVAAPLAATLDRENRFPSEMFEALQADRLTSLCVPEAQGGYGLGPDGKDALPVWLSTRALATVDSSSAHAFQVHTNTTHGVALLGTPEQHERFLRPVVEDGAVFGFWGSEQSGAPPDGGPRGYTMAHRVDGGWELTGKKFYSTNAGATKYGVVFAYPDDVDKPLDHLMLFAVDCDSPGVHVRSEWWDAATGMRSTASHQVDFDGVFVDDGAVIGSPGGYWKEQVQARYLPQFSSNFQGVGAHMFNDAMQYLTERGRTKNDFTLRYMAEARVQLNAAELMLGRAADLYRERRMSEAYDASRQVRAFSESAVRRVIELVQASCGSSFYLGQGGMERVLRDWQFYSRHENVDLILRAIGRSEFGMGGEGTAAAFGFGGGGGSQRD